MSVRDYVLEELCPWGVMSVRGYVREGLCPTRRAYV